MNLFAQKAYHKLVPGWARDHDYYRISSFLKQSEYWDSNRWNDYQWKQTYKILCYAVMNVPYYTNLFKEAGLTLDRIRGWDDFRMIPVLTKKIAQQNVADLLTTQQKIRNKKIPFSTSGSTGHPLSFFTTHEQITATRAFMDNQWSRIGFTPYSSRVVIRGLQTDQLIERKSFYLWNISTHGLRRDNINEIMSFFDKERPAFIHAYPSSLWLLYNYMIDNGAELKYCPKGILLGSEKYPERYRPLFEEFFGCRSFSWIGLAEATILAGECEQSTQYHVHPAYSYVELINSGNHTGSGMRIIGTSFFNRAFPFIRYDCGDIGEWDKECSCGRRFPILGSLIGRSAEYLVDIRGQLHSLTAVYSAIHSGVLSNIVECQFHQNEAGKVEVVLKTNDKYALDDEIAFGNELHKRTGGLITFTFNCNNPIVIDKSGKVRILISSIGS